jgi:hypothetical protein
LPHCSERREEIRNVTLSKKKKKKETKRKSIPVTGREGQ